MQQIITTCREAAVATLPLLPVFCIVNHYRIHDWKRSTVYLLLSIYLSAMYAAVGLPDITYLRFKPHFNFVPFLYMFSAWETTLLNVLLFLPLGCFLPLLWSEYSSPFKTVFFGFSVSLLIELLQIFTYRATDINDLMTNTVGTILGYLGGRIALRAFPSILPDDSTKDLSLIFCITFAVMFLIYPHIARFLL